MYTYCVAYVVSMLMLLISMANFLHNVRLNFLRECCLICVGMY